MKISRYLFLFFCLISLADCARWAPQQATPTYSWAERQQQLTQLSRWQMQGAFSLRGIEKPVSANFIWQQRDIRSLTARFLGPFGSGQILLETTTDHAQLTTAEGTTRARNATALLYNQLGWRLPVEDLYYWLRGLPDPAYPAKRQFDENNRLRQLQQRDWTINYTRYQQINGFDLPTKFDAFYRNIRLRVVIRAWHFQPPRLP